MLDQRNSPDRRDSAQAEVFVPFPDAKQQSEGILGFIVFSDVVITNPPGSFNGLKITQTVTELKRHLLLSSMNINARAFMNLLEEIRSQAYCREWISLTVRTGMMCLPEGSHEAFQIIWVPGGGVIDSAIWYKK
jgi:hypothetical protein